MKLQMIKEGKEKNEIDFKDTDPFKELPDLVIKKVERKIRDGAKDYDQEWKNSINLVDWAFDELNISKPKSVSSPRWIQYRDMIGVAAQSLHKARKNFGTVV